VDSYHWVDLEGRGSVQPETSASINANTGKLAFIWTDYNPVASTSANSNVEVKNSNVLIQNFGTDDLFYMDNNAKANNISSWTHFAENGQMLINAESADGSAHFSWLPYNPNPLVDENLRGLTYFKLDNSWTQSNLITSNTLLQSLVDGNVVLAG
ncbi:MAG: hypothetical protein EBR31_06460, partial [Methylophilaceae bacterium]|nr:hypothetical protein [Methylophilaceae bacterium]